MNEKKRLNIYIIAAVILCAGIVFAYKAYGVYSDIRTQLNIIEENTRNNGYGNDNVLENIYTLQSKAGADVGRYEFDYSWMEGNLLIAHAMGGIDNQNYLNCKEGMELAYENGYRVFEGDFCLLDDRVVLMHDTGSFFEASGLQEENLDYDSFCKAKLCGKYTTMDLSDVVLFLSEHPDAWFMTDSKYDKNPHMVHVLSELVIKAQEYDESVLDRIIVQIYNQNMLKSVMDVYPFRSVVYTTYLSNDMDNELIQFCLRTGVGAVTTHGKRMTEDFSSQLSAAGIKSLVFTINDVETAQNYVDMGVSCIYSDFILPGQLHK